MKHLLSGALLGLIAAALVAGCSDDGTSNPPPTPADTTYMKYDTGSTYTYNYYERDASNQRVEATKQVKVWKVLKINQTTGERGGVTVIQEVSYDGTGTTPTGAVDTFYVQSTSEGEVSQYNLLRSVVKRIPGGEIFLDSVPPKWILIGNTKRPTAGTWDAIDGGKIINTVAIATIPTTVTLAMNAAHAGKQSVTVPKETIADSYHTDHKMVITTESAVFNSKDTFNISYDVSPKYGIVRQVLKSATFLNGSQTIPGFEMELVAVTKR